MGGAAWVTLHEAVSVEAERQFWVHVQSQSSALLVFLARFYLRDASGVLIWSGSVLLPLPGRFCFQCRLFGRLSTGLKENYRTDFPEILVEDR